MKDEQAAYHNRLGGPILHNNQEVARNESQRTPGIL